MDVLKLSPMETRVYYGEYTLRHWLNLLLNRGICLPEYQRSFVWGEADVRRLIYSFESGQFVQPVTIAHYKDEEGEQNLILDGQQRLTSILLAYLGYMPIKEKFDSVDFDLATGDDSAEDEQNVSMEWTYNILLKKSLKDNSVPLIKSRLQADNRYSLMENITKKDLDDFYDNTFLGFSFIIPMSSDVNETQRYFSTLFRNMNYLGKKLSPLESRRSLYFMNRECKNFFDGRLQGNEDILCNIRILENMQPKKIDFVRYLSTIAQYIGVGRYNRVLLGYSAYSSRESYYADFVSYVVGLEQENRKDKFDSFKMKSTFPNQEWTGRFVIVHDFLERNKHLFGLDEKTLSFTSWIDADYWLYGLLYWVLFKGKSLSNEGNLISDIRSEVTKKRNPQKNPDYVKNPNRLGNLRDRMESSIKLYGDYAI